MLAEQRSFGVLGSMIGQALAVSLALILIYSATAKLLRPEAFAASLATFGWISPRGQRFLSGAVPGAELATAILIGFHSTRSAGLVIGALEIVGFTAVLVTALLRGRQVDCGCFGGRNDIRSPGLGIVRNALLIGIAGGAIADQRQLALSVPALLSGVAVASIVLLVFEALTAMTKIGIGSER